MASLQTVRCHYLINIRTHISGNCHSARSSQASVLPAIPSCGSFFGTRLSSKPRICIVTFRHATACQPRAETILVEDTSNGEKDSLQTLSHPSLELERSGVKSSIQRRKKVTRRKSGVLGIRRKRTTYVDDEVEGDRAGSNAAENSETGGVGSGKKRSLTDEEKRAEFERLRRLSITLGNLRLYGKEEVDEVVQALQARYAWITIASESVRTVEFMLGLGFRVPEVYKIFSKFSGLYQLRQGDSGTVEDIVEKLEVFDQYGMSETSFVKTCCHHPHLIGAGSAQVEEVLHFLKEECLVHNFDRAVNLAPAVLRFKPATLRTKLEHIKALGIRRVDKVMAGWPNVLTYGLQELTSKFACLGSIIGRDILIDVLESCPSLLAANEETVRDTHDELLSSFGPELFRVLVTKTPKVIGVKRATVRETFGNLADLFGYDGALQMVTAQPSLITLQWRTIQPKIDFVTRRMGRGLGEIQGDPVVLMRSLRNRLVPRYVALQRIGRADLPVKQMFCHSDETFERRYDVDLDKVRADLDATDDDDDATSAAVGDSNAYAAPF